jgi:CheY-like chemotaxis protein
MEKLLLVDDDEALRRLMRLELSDTYEIIDSGQPEAGLALALEHKPDAILLDLRMPNYSGYELLQTFTGLSLTDKIPVIVVSGEAGAQTKEHCKQLGAFGYFEKPIDFEGLRTCLSQIGKTRKFVPRTEVRVRLHVPLKLKGTNSLDKQFDELTVTENVSLSGFFSTVTTELSANSVVDVYLADCGDKFVGRARIIHPHVKTTSARQYGFRFVEKTGPWVLQ